VQVTGKLKLILNSGQQSFSNATRLKVNHAGSSGEDGDVTMVETLIPSTELPLHSSMFHDYKPMVDPDARESLLGVPEGCVSSCGHSCSARLSYLAVSIICTTYKKGYHFIQGLTCGYS